MATSNSKTFLLLLGILCLFVVTAGSYFLFHAEPGSNQATIKVIDDNSYVLHAQLSGGSNIRDMRIEKSCCYQHEEFSRDTLLIDGNPVLSGESVEFAGVCVTAESRLAILASHWNGSATLESSLMAYQYEGSNGNFSEVVVDLYGGGAYLDDEDKLNGEEFGQGLADQTSDRFEPIHCRPSESLFGEDGVAFTPCLCDLDKIIEIEELEETVSTALKASEDLSIASFSEEFFEGEIAQFSTMSISDKEVQSALKKIDSIKGLPFYIHRMESYSSEVISIVYEKLIYDSFSVLLMRDKGSDDWHAVYTATPSSKGFHPPELISLSDNGILRTNMCLEGCDWWGNRFGVVDITLSPESDIADFKFIEESEMY